ncbi:acyltransferase [Dyadobacter sp. LHD-138]|uniref:acyltransferase family protein n=1 Tax=Dyadobacter sp. LHD-138 TaxID=3071413 RepID=UPI0027DF5E19|nr:acyltransferase [Dyadobacter sp. LHD-138]MDQ6480994.1 acyltransferase [Dyadobacter sp. LHD-138]
MVLGDKKIKLSYYKELDGVRAIAILMVMFFHFFSDLNTTSKTLLLLKRIALMGETGVTLFFVLSGFLITRILLSTRESKNYFYNFFVRRSLRIFPLYYLFLIIYYLTPLFFGGAIPEFGLQIYYWIYLQDFSTTFGWKSDGPGQFWSLAVEEHFYLVWPFLIYYLHERAVILWISAIIIIAFVLRIYLSNYYPLVHHFTFTRMDDLAIGAILAVLEYNGFLKGSKAIYFLLILIPINMVWVLNRFLDPSIANSIVFLQTSLSYCSLIGFVICLSENNWLKKLLSQTPFIYTGKVSYGLYVFHPFCFKLFEIFFITRYWMVNLLGSLVFTYSVASLSYYFFESYFLKLKAYFHNNDVRMAQVSE